MIKDEVILVFPGPSGFFLRGVSFNDFLNKIARRAEAVFFKRGPKRVEAPLSILFLGTALKKAGFAPRLIDGRYENIREKLKSYINEKTLFVGISSMTSYQIVFGLKTAEIVRRARPDIPIVWGGLHATVLPEETLATSRYADIVVRREGETAAVALARAMQEGRSLEDIKGISYKDAAGRIVNNIDAEFLDFDKVPMPDYGLLDKSVYDLSYLTYQSSRGCPHRCRFCEVGPIHKRRYRSRSVETMIGDIEYLIKTHSVREVNFIDENVFVNLDNARRFAGAIIAKGLKFEWRAFCRADYFRRTDADFWSLMKEAGCQIINIGGESGSQKTLDSIQKDYRVEDITNAATQLEKAGIDNSFSFICGLPGEEGEDIEKTVDLTDYMIKNFKRFNLFEIFTFMPLPMTALYDELRRDGLIRPPARLGDWGTFIWGNRRYTKWHPLHEYVFRLSYVSKWTKRPTLRKILHPLKHLDIFLFLMYCCGYISYFRWRRKFFRFPADIYLQHWLNKHIFKCLWQR